MGGLWSYPGGVVVLGSSIRHDKLRCSFVWAHAVNEDGGIRNKNNNELDDSLALSWGTSKLKDEALLNIACDALAGEVTEAAINAPEEQPSPEELMQMPYEGSCAVLKIGDTWVTANCRDAMYEACRGPIACKRVHQAKTELDRRPV